MMSGHAHYRLKDVRRAAWILDREKYTIKFDKFLKRHPRKLFECFINAPAKIMLIAVSSGRRNSNNTRVFPKLL